MFTWVPSRCLQIQWMGGWRAKRRINSAGVTIKQKKDTREEATQIPRKMEFPQEHESWSELSGWFLPPAFGALILSCPSAWLSPLPSRMLLSITFLAWTEPGTSPCLSHTTDKHDKTCEYDVIHISEGKKMSFTCCSRCYEYLSAPLGIRRGVENERKPERVCLFPVVSEVGQINVGNLNPFRSAQGRIKERNSDDFKAPVLSSFRYGLSAWKGALEGLVQN